MKLSLSSRVADAGCKAAAIIALVLWACSLFIPVAFDAEGRSTIGYEILLSGWAAILAGDGAWCCNIIVPTVAIWAFFPARLPWWVKIGCALVLAGLGYQALDFWAIPDGYVIIRHGAGYFMWLISVALSAASLVISALPTANRS